MKEPANREVISVGSGFGTVLGRLVRHTPGATGAVLCDEHGDAIDFAHRPAQISELDVQLHGAQVTRALGVFSSSLERRGLRDLVVVVEADNGSLVTAWVTGAYAMTLVTDRDVPLPFTLRQFSLACDDLAALLS